MNLMSVPNGNAYCTHNFINNFDLPDDLNGLLRIN